MANYNRKNRSATERSQSREKYSSQPSAWRWLLIGVSLGVIGVLCTYLILTHQTSLKSLQQLASRPFEKKPLDEKQQLEKSESSEGSKELQVSKQSENPKKQKTAQRFEFYQLLPGMEVPIPDNTENPSNKGKTPQLIPPVTTPLKPINKEKLSPEKRPLEKTTNNSVKANAKPEKKSSPPKLATTQIKLAAPQYLIQVDASRTQQKAENLKAMLARQGFSARIQKVEAGDGLWYRVILGPFSSETMAHNQKKRLAKQNIQGILIMQRR